MIWVLFIVGLALGVIFNIWWHRLKDKKTRPASPVDFSQLPADRYRRSEKIEVELPLVPGPYTSDLSPAEVVAIERRGNAGVITQIPAADWKPKPGGRDWQHDSDGLPVDRGLVPTMFLDSFLLRHFHSIIQIPSLSSGFVPTWDGFTKANPWAYGLDQVFLELSGFKLTKTELDQVAGECADRLRSPKHTHPVTALRPGCETCADLMGPEDLSFSSSASVSPCHKCDRMILYPPRRKPQSANAVESQPASDRPEERQQKSGSIL